MVRFEYKHFAFLGPESVRAAEASECANEQGQFWPYHDILFANQSGENIGTFSDDALKAFAEAIGLDTGAFDDCLDSNRYQDLVETEFFEAQGREVSTTPTIFINGEAFEGALPFEQFQAIIEAELAQSG